MADWAASVDASQSPRWPPTKDARRWLAGPPCHCVLIAIGRMGHLVACPPTKKHQCGKKRPGKLLSNGSSGGRAIALLARRTVQSSDAVTAWNEPQQHKLGGGGEDEEVEIRCPPANAGAQEAARAPG